MHKIVKEIAGNKDVLLNMNQMNVENRKKINTSEME